MNNLKSLLEDVKAIMVREGETRFEDLRLRDKQEIFDLAVACIGKENLRFCGDSENGYVIHNEGEVHIAFCTRATGNNLDDNRESLEGFTVDEDQTADLIEGIDKVLTVLAGQQDNRLPLALLNTSIITADGDFSLRTITLEEAKTLVEEANGLDSAIGHDSTAQIMSALLGTEIPVNRQMFVQQPSQQAVVFKLNGRPEEGKILTVDEIEKIGYSFKLLTMEV